MKRKRRGERRSPGPGRGRGSSPPGRLQPPLLIVVDTGRTAAPGLKTGMKQERRRPENALPALPYGSGATFPASVIADQVAREPGCVCATEVVPAAPEWLAYDSGEVAFARPRRRPGEGPSTRRCKCRARRVVSLGEDTRRRCRSGASAARSDVTLRREAIYSYLPDERRGLQDGLDNEDVFERAGRHPPGSAPSAWTRTGHVIRSDEQEGCRRSLACSSAGWRGVRCRDRGRRGATNDAARQQHPHLRHVPLARAASLLHRRVRSAPLDRQLHRGAGIPPPQRARAGRANASSRRLSSCRSRSKSHSAPSGCVNGAKCHSATRSSPEPHSRTT